MFNFLDLVGPIEINFSVKIGKYNGLRCQLKKKGNFFSKISDVQIDYQTNWIDKHLNFFIFNFKNDDNYKKIFKLIEKILLKYGRLIELNLELIKIYLIRLRIKK